MLFGAVFALAAVAGVSAHGFVSNVAIGGKNFAGPFPFSNNNAASPIRKITTTFPITSANDANMNCGIGAVAAAQIAAANPGDRVTLTWKSGRSANWGHSIGPIMTYLAQVPAGQTADKFNTRNAKWFKIDQTGQTGGAGTGWVQASIKGGKTYSLSLPANLPAGDYIMRHELIALHFAQKQNGAQFYPSCIQLRVGGGSNAPKAITGVQTVAFPGGYTNNQPDSLFVPNLFKNNFVYKFPGPAVAKSFGTRSISDNSTIVDPESEPEFEAPEVKRTVAPDHGRARSRSRARRVAGHA